ncbi:MAG: cytochrome c maturation protein CcmE [Porticoccaceae bacterium]
MHPIRRQRLIAVLFIAVVATAAVGLLTYALRQNINLFYTPAQVVAGEVPEGTRIRVGGMVVKDSVSRMGDSLETRFTVTDGEGDVVIVYTGILPDLFAENEAAVATGELRGDGVFAATEVLAKHDENYTPPEVADAMNKAKERALEARQ